MIRRLNKKSDLKDLIKSCPSGVIDDIYAIEYYIQGYNTVIQANFTKKGDMLEVIIPSTELETLPNGILMRRAYYKVLDASYPDGYYNLEFEDNMNVWIGENESEPGPVPGEYVTEEELSSTLSSYATQEWISSQGYLTTETLPSDIATEEWVASQGYLTAVPSEYATESWVSEQGYLTSHQDLTGYATESWVSSNFLTSVPSEYATQSWVNYFVENNDQNPCIRAEDFDGYISTAGVATQSWVESQGYLTSHQDLTGYATQSWVSAQGYLSAGALSSALSGYATESYVDQAINDAVFGSDVPIPDLSSYATMSWVSDQGYLTEHQDLTGYATESWVASNYLSAVPSEYATQSWATSQFLEESKIWTGTEAQWNQLTAAQKALYTIALITQ